MSQFWKIKWVILVIVMLVVAGCGYKNFEGSAEYKDDKGVKYKASFREIEIKGGKNFDAVTDAVIASTTIGSGNTGSLTDILEDGVPVPVPDPQLPGEDTPVVDDPDPEPVPDQSVVTKIDGIFCDYSDEHNRFICRFEKRSGPGKLYCDGKLIMMMDDMSRRINGPNGALWKTPAEWNPRPGQWSDSSVSLAEYHKRYSKCWIEF